MYVLVMGMAGSGKTTLVATYSEWLKTIGETPRIVNLDPGAEEIPYKPDFDIRRLFTVQSIMKEYGLGPNGALLKASELIVKNAEEILRDDAFKAAREAQVLIDTPGQLEVFMLRGEGKEFTRLLKQQAPTVGIFLVDASLSVDVSDFITSWVMGLLIQVRLEIPVVPVINKVDVAHDRRLLELIVTNPSELLDIVEKNISGVSGEIVEDLVRLVEDYQQSLRPILLSAKNRTGFEDLYSVIHEAFCSCGDLS